MQKICTFYIHAHGFAHVSPRLLLPQPPHIHPQSIPQKGGGAKRRPPFVEAVRSAASFMDGCVVAVQVEDFGLPKSAVGTVGQTSIFVQAFDP